MLHKNASSIILKAENLQKSFADVSVLKNINLELRQGSSAAILGASGEGKTTLLHLLGGLEKPSLGKIFYQEAELTSQNALTLRSKHFGFVFQFFNLLEDLSALDNVLMPACIAFRNKKDHSQKALQLLAEVGMAELAYKTVKTFSGGEKQRVAIARAFCNDPEIIFADEPSGNLDHQNSKKIGQILLSFVKNKRKSLVLVTHNQELASLCDQKYLLQDGLLQKFS